MISSKNPIPVVPNTAYAITRPATAIDIILFYDVNDNYVGYG